jgi:hypothetical protein
MLGDMASFENLHGYGESLFNKWGMQADLAKHALWRTSKELTSKYVLAKTELLVLSGA